MSNIDQKFTIKKALDTLQKEYSKWNVLKNVKNIFGYSILLGGFYG